MKIIKSLTIFLVCISIFFVTSFSANAAYVSKEETLAFSVPNDLGGVALMLESAEVLVTLSDDYSSSGGGYLSTYRAISAGVSRYNGDDGTPSLGPNHSYTAEYYASSSGYEDITCFTIVPSITGLYPFRAYSNATTQYQSGSGSKVSTKVYFYVMEANIPAKSVSLTLYH